MKPGGANGGVEREGGITMTGTMAEVLPEVPMTDNEVGVEIIFLEPDQEPAGEVAHPGAWAAGWGEGDLSVKHA